MPVLGWFVEEAPMRAARFHAREDVRIDDLPEPETTDGTVKVKVDWCGICGTDLHEYLEGPIFTPADAPHPLTGERNPVQLGHEFAGRIAEVGKGVTGLSEGDAVAVEPTLFCGECPECRAGLTNLCTSLGFHGLSGGGGGFAEYTVVRASMVRPLGEVPTDLGALVEPLAVGLHAVRKSGVRIGESAVVFGAGPIGLAVITMLRAAGVTTVVSVEVARARKELAERAGASAVIDGTREDVVEAIRAAAGGLGPDVAFECAGVPAVLNTALHAVKRTGTVVNVAIWGAPTQLHPNDLVFSEAYLTGIIGYLGDHPATIGLLAGDLVDVGFFITKRIGLEELVEGGFHDLVENKDEHVKILVQP
jgi:(R,R)-butanediol dehydrogenase/meso-butanediol dehydrogenase/diacetyl reductase